MVKQVQREPVETKFASELQTLANVDDAPRPTGWQLSPRAVRRFVLGDDTLNVTQKFFGDDALVDRAIVSLMGQQGLMLVGEPGTAKSMISELLAAAIGGVSTLVVQGSAGVVEDHLRYGWNYALLLAEGPSERALVPSPLLTGMQSGQIVRIEELTRCAPEVQDAMISLLSEKTIVVPELGPQVEYRAAPGFNVIATANLRDRGVHDMSSALKRRFNFETVHPIEDARFEKRLIAQQLAERMAAHQIASEMPEPVLDLVVAVFRDLRRGVTEEGVSVPVPGSVMSTAEAVNTAHAAVLAATFLDGGAVTGSQIARQLRGVAFKDDPEDARKLRAYTDQIAKVRAGSDPAWAAFYKTAREDDARL